MAPTKETTLLSVKEVAKILGVSPNRVYQIKDAKLIKFIKVGSLKCRLTSLEEFLDEYDGQDVDEIISNINNSKIEEI